MQKYFQKKQETSTNLKARKQHGRVRSNIFESLEFGNSKLLILKLRNFATLESWNIETLEPWIWGHFGS